MYMRNRKIAESEEEGAIRMAISLLAYKENAKAAVRFAVEKNYLCEERYFQRFAERCAIDRLFGKRRVIQEARRKGFSERTIKEAADFLKEMDFDELCYRALKKAGNGSKEKTVVALNRRGFSTTNIRYAFLAWEEEFGMPYGAEEIRRYAEAENCEDERPPGTSKDPPHSVQGLFGPGASLKKALIPKDFFVWSLILRRDGLLPNRR